MYQVLLLTLFFLVVGVMITMQMKWLFEHGFPIQKSLVVGRYMVAIAMLICLYLLLGDTVSRLWFFNQL